MSAAGLDERRVRLKMAQTSSSLIAKESNSTVRVRIQVRTLLYLGGG